MQSQITTVKPNSELGIIVLESCKELGQKINKALVNRRSDMPEYAGLHKESYLISTKEVRFSNGEGKVVINDSVRGKDIYVICDIGNYSCTYEMFGFINHKSPDDHFQDIKRVLSAIEGKARKVTVVMPLLYASRQHRRRSRESLDCAIALQELERLGVKDIITFDVHDPTVQNAIPMISFDNIYPSQEIIKMFLQEEDLQIDKDSIIVISPDTGAMDRAIYYSGVLGLDIGLFYKRRDHSKVIEGKNPIVQHEYMGREIADKDVLIVDDMISSGESIFDIVDELKKRKARRVFVSATFALFAKGVEKFNRYYKEGLIDKVYSTNLTYIPDEARNSEWFKEVDMSRFIGSIINNLNLDLSIGPLIHDTAYLDEIKKNNFK